MDSCTSFLASQLVAEVTIPVSGRVLPACQPGPETWLCRSWAVDSSFTGWAGGTAPSALARPSGVITKGGMGGLATVGPALPLPRYQGESKAAAAHGATAAGRVSVKLPNGS